MELKALAKSVLTQIKSLFDSITPLTDMTNLAAAALDLLSMGGDILDRKFLEDRTGILSYSLLMTLNNQMTTMKMKSE